MAQVPRHIKCILVILVVSLCSTANLFAVDPRDTDGDEIKKEKKEVVDIADKVEGEISEKIKVETDSDSLKSAKKIAKTHAKASNDTKVKKNDNSQSSLVSYNFVFYLMYKFKIADIFNISKEKNTLPTPAESTLRTSGSQLIKKLVYRLTDQVQKKYY